MSKSNDEIGEKIGDSFLPRLIVIV